MSASLEELALSANGCYISQATSSHEKYSCLNIIDGKVDTFWASCGLFPQQFTISFPAMVLIDTIKIRSYFVQTVLVERCTSKAPGKFEEVSEKELSLTDNCLQINVLSSEQIPAHHLRFTIKNAYDFFCAIYKLHVTGVVLNNGGINEDYSSGLAKRLSRQMSAPKNPTSPKGRPRVREVSRFSAVNRSRDELSAATPPPATPLQHQFGSYSDIGLVREEEEHEDEDEDDEIEEDDVEEISERLSKESRSDHVQHF